MEGLVVGFPSMEAIPFDFFVWDEHQTASRVQVKYLRFASDRSCLEFHPRKSGKHLYTRSDCDVIAAVNPDLDLIYLIPVDAIETQTIRIYPGKNTCRFSDYLSDWSKLKGGNNARTD